MEFKKIQSYTFLVGLIGITLVFFWMLKSYLYPVFWAAVIAALFHPVYERLLKKTKKPSLAASTTLLIVICIFLLPLAGIVSLIAQQAYMVYKDFGNQETFYAVSNTLQNYLQLPILQNVMGDINIQERISSWGASISKFVYEFAATGGQNTVRILIQFFIMLYALYYFLRDGGMLLRKLMHLIPLGDRYEKELYSQFVSTARATLKGTVVIGVIQGAIGAVAFLITGVPGAIFWGVIMIVLSIIPGVGAAVILLPAIVIMFLLGNVWQAVILIVALLIAGVIDNVLRGPLVGKDTQMHPLLIFFATLGGLLSFGLSGVVIGPVLTAFLLSMWKIYERKFKTDLDRAD